MGKITSQAKSELKQLPFMLGKLLGSVVAIVGFTLAVLKVTRNPGYSFEDLVVYLVVGVGGIFIFMLSGKLLVKSLSESKDHTSTSEKSMFTSLLPWGVLLSLVAIFLLFSYLMTR